MTPKQIEERFERLENELKQVKSQLACGAGRGWRAVVGSHQGSKTFDGIVREMRRLRQQDYQDARGT